MVEQRTGNREERRVVGRDEIEVKRDGRSKGTEHDTRRVCVCVLSCHIALQYI